MDVMLVLCIIWKVEMLKSQGIFELDLEGWGVKE
jgi:hypothetical protein